LLSISPSQNHDHNVYVSHPSDLARKYSAVRKNYRLRSTLVKDLSKAQTGRSNALIFNTSDGTERSYLIHVPDVYDANIPTGLIWSSHGRGKDSEHQEKITKFSDPSSTPDYIVVYPQGMSKNANTWKTGRRQEVDDEDDNDYKGENWGDEEDGDGYGDEEGDVEAGSAGGKSSGKKGAWQGDPDVQADDVKFTLELLDNITKTFCIDGDRIYTSGISNGGGFAANVLACDAIASTKFAAFASASGAYYQDGSKDKCDAKKYRSSATTTAPKFH
jgi:poly(3-hydroxybutyrate) depolymerase